MKISTKISSRTIYLIVFLSALLLSGDLISSEVSVLIACFFLILLMLKISKINAKEITIVLPLLLILFTGIAGALFHNKLGSRDGLYLVGKDIWYYLKPVIYLFTGFYVYRLNMKKETFFSLILYITLIISIHHIIRFIVFIATASPDLLVLDKIRYRTGPGSLLESLMLAYLLLLYRYSDTRKNMIFPRWFLISVISISVILSFSRTLFLGFLLSLLAMQDFFSFRANAFLKTLIALFSVVLIAFLALFYIHKFSDRDSVVYAITGKYLNSLKELTYENENPTFRQINENWRGLETSITMDEIKKGNLPEKLFGFGFGKTVYIDFRGLPGIVDPNIPKFHNGFIEIRLKTGFLGILFYILFFYFAFRISDRTFPSGDTDKLLKAILVTSFATTLFITGLYNKSAMDPLCIIAGYLMGYAGYTGNNAEVKSQIE